MVQFQHKPNIKKHISYCHNFFQNSFSQKNTKRKRLRGKCKYWQKSVKTEQLVKMNFLKNLTLLRSENPELEKVAYIAQDYAQKNSGQFDFSVILYDLNSGQQKSVSCAEIRIIVSTFHQRPYLAQQRHKRKDTEGLLRK